MDQNSDMMHFVFSTDDNYCQHRAVAISSLLLNNHGKSFALHIIETGISRENIDRLTATVCAHENAELHFYKFETRQFNHFRLDDHITLAAYIRLFLPGILPQSLTRVVYLDCDLVVVSDVSELWETDLGDKLMAAALEPFSPDPSRLGLPNDYSYFNSGVLLIDLQGWRERALTPILLNYVESNSSILRYHDQDALNVVLGSGTILLPYKWNFQARTKLEDLGAGTTRHEFAVLRRTARIIHFTTGDKPWKYFSNCSFEDQYFKYLQATPWRNFKQPDKSLRHVTRRFLMRYFPPAHRLWLALKPE